MQGAAARVNRNERIERNESRKGSEGKEKKHGSVYADLPERTQRKYGPSTEVGGGRVDLAWSSNLGCTAPRRATLQSGGRGVGGHPVRLGFLPVSCCNLLEHGDDWVKRHVVREGLWERANRRQIAR